MLLNVTLLYNLGMQMQVTLQGDKVFTLMCKWYSKDQVLKSIGTLQSKIKEDKYGVFFINIEEIFSHASAQLLLMTIF